jgi:hypothetical protein
MATNVLLTIDTELTHRHLAAGLGWEDNFDRSYQAAGVGVPYQLEMLAAHGLKACFFVDPMPAVRYGLEPVRRMVDPILAAGQEVQLHLHPFWTAAEGGEGEGPVFELTGLDRETQRALIRDARDLLVEAGAPMPIAFRAGSYAADAATLAALADLGIRYDSSHNGGHHPWPSALPLDPLLIDPVEVEGVIEVPVSQIASSKGGLRHLQLCAVSHREMRAALHHAADAGHRATTIVSHSFELATRDGRRPNRVLRRRFEQLCELLAGNQETMPTRHFTDFAVHTSGAAASPLPPERLREAGRIVEQFWSEARYERPASALTAVSGSSAAGLEALIPLLL